jgi:hypothetical protein
MFRKLLLAAVAVAGLMVTVDTPSADAGWRRVYRRGYYAAPGYYYRPRYYAPVYRPVYNYGYGYPGYYGSYGYGYPYGYSYGYPGYYGGYWGPGVGVQAGNFGFYVR